MAAEGGGGLPILSSIFNAIMGGSGFQADIAFRSMLAWSNNFLHNVVGLFKVVGSFFRSVWGFLKHVWENYIKRAIQWLADHVRKLRNWLQRTISPIVKRLEKIKKWYDQHILKQQLRTLQMIQRIRQVLGILKLFHVKWATKLDNSLADIQNRIEEAISVVRGHLNGIANWLNAIYDPVWLAGRLHIGGFFIQSLDAHLRAAGIGGISNWGAESDKAGNGSIPNGHVAAIANSMHQDNVGGGGAFSEFGATGKAAWKFQDANFT